MPTYKHKPTSLMARQSVYDKEAAAAAVRFVRYLSHTKGQWKGTSFELMPWQERIIRDVFGIVNRKSRFRQFKQAYCEIPKKAGKSELAAAVALFLLAGDGEPTAEVYGCACDKQQASIVFDVAVDMVELFPLLKENIKLNISTKSMRYKPTGGVYRVCSSESYSKHGLNASGVVFDELHAQPDRRLFDVMTHGSGDARRQPLTFMISTAGNNQYSIGYEVHTKALDILQGRKTDPAFYPLIYGAGPDDDWTDPEVWKRANPSIGVTVPIERIAEACESAKQNAAEENLFRQLHLNQWVKQSVRWIPLEKWDECAGAVDEDGLKGRACYGGLDLSKSEDITAFVLVFPPKEDGGTYTIIPHFWIPQDNMQKRALKDHVPYDIWHQKGYLEATPGNVISYRHITEKIAELAKQYDIKEIAFDRWGATQIYQDLEDEGHEVIQYGQGYKDMSPAAQELFRLIQGGKIAHGGQPVLRWMADNVVITQDAAGNIKPDKNKSSEKIDGIVALIMALDRAIKREDKGAARYAKRGILTL